MTIRELTGADLRLAAPVLLHLRPHHGGSEPLLARLEAVVASDGLRVLGSFPDGTSEIEPAAVATYRINENLAHGRTLYVDDLVTSPEHRGKGHGRALMERLDHEARAAGCAGIHLDSGVGEHRFDAHRLYFAHGLRITSHHFARPLNDPG